LQHLRYNKNSCEKLHPQEGDPKERGKRRKRLELTSSDEEESEEEESNQDEEIEDASSSSKEESSNDKVKGNEDNYATRPYDESLDENYPRSAARLKLIETERDEYYEQLLKAHYATIANLEKFAALRTSEHKDCATKLRAFMRVDKTLEHIWKARTPKPLLLHEYRAGVSQGTIHDQSGIFLYLSAEQARELLADGRPRVNFIVLLRLDLRVGPLMRVDKFAAKLRTFDTVNVHNFQPSTTNRRHARQDTAGR
jgi:hypothetical protein